MVDMTALCTNTDISTATSEFESPTQQLSEFIFDPAFPCVGAKSALKKQRMTFAEYSSIDEKSVVSDLCQRLQEFSEAYPEPGASPVSFVALFAGAFEDEFSFETALWKLLQAMHGHDRINFKWDSTVGGDPTRNDFSFSVAGRAFFVVGLHPAASRMSRRAPFPCLVFNFHNQFETLKASGKYQSMQTAVRMRDVQLQGSINPVLARFGEASEARQYSGRAVETSWQCPFHAMELEHV